MSNSINCKEDYFNTEHGKVYLLKYEGGNSTNTPLIMIHGGPGFTHHYLEPLYTLANERPVIFYDQLGCGKSDIPEDSSYLSVEYFVNELETLVQHIGYDSVSLLGHSWGSTVAAEYAIRNSNVSHLILASPYLSSPLWNIERDYYLKQMSQEDQKTIKEKDFTSAAYLTAQEKYYTKHVYGRARNDRSIALSNETASSKVYNIVWGHNEIYIDGILKNYDCTDRLNKISANSLFICGENDTGGPKACKAMSKMIDESQLKIISDCAHFPHLEKKLEYVNSLRRFLNNENIEDKKSILSSLKNLFK